MHDKKRFMALLFIALIFNASNTNAVYFDSLTGLYWLELTATQNQSYNTVVGRITSGDLAGAGWQYATANQVDTLVTHFGGTPGPGACSPQNYCGWSAANNGVVDDLVATFGDLGGDSVSLGIHEDYGAVRWHATWYDYPQSSNSTTMDFISTLGGSFTLNYAQENAGSLLVTTLPPVPIPAAAYLFGSALIALGVIRRKRQ